MEKINLASYSAHLMLWFICLLIPNSFKQSSPESPLNYVDSIPETHSTRGGLPDAPGFRYINDVWMPSKK